MRTIITGIAIVAGLSVFACKKPANTDTSTTTAATASGAAAAGPKGGSCVDPRGQCTEYTDNTLGVAEAACKMFEGKYIPSACPTADVIGRCDDADGQKTYYYAGNFIAPWVSDAKRDCEENPARTKKGKFTAQPNMEDVAKQKALPSTDKVIGSCQLSEMCEDIFEDTLKMEKDTCTQVQGKWATTPCPTADVAASCLKAGKVQRYSHKMFKFTKPSAVENLCNSDSVLMWGHYYPGDIVNAQAKGDHKAAPSASHASKAKK